MTGKTGFKSLSRKQKLLIAMLLVLFGLMLLDTKFVSLESQAALQNAAFDPERYGKQTFPRIQDFVAKRAATADVLAETISTDKKAAIAAHGTPASIGAVMAVTLSGVAGNGTSGIFDLAVPDIPKDIRIRVQTGPAINGTELRDVPGDISFGAFKNQIEYQNAGAGINRAMSAAVLKDLDRDNLTGKTLAVTGVFTLINPKSWLITPVQLEVTP